jgi:hypothetical protein
MNDELKRLEDITDGQPRVFSSEQAKDRDAYETWQALTRLLADQKQAAPSINARRLAEQILARPNVRTGFSFARWGTFATLAAGLIVGIVYGVRTGLLDPGRKPTELNSIAEIHWNDECDQHLLAVAQSLRQYHENDAEGFTKGDGFEDELTRVWLMYEHVAANL